MPKGVKRETFAAFFFQAMFLSSLITTYKVRREFTGLELSEASWRF